MTTDMKREVNDLMQMAVNWRRGYEGWLTPDDDNDYVYREFIEEMQTHLMPYLNRLREEGYLSDSDSTAMVNFYLEQVELLKIKSKKMKEEADGASRTD